MEQKNGIHFVYDDETGADGRDLGDTGTGGRLFLGTQKAAQNRSLLERHGISRIVCVGTPAFHENIAESEGLDGGAGSSADWNTCIDSSNNIINSISTNNINNSGSGSGQLIYLKVDVLDLPSENILGSFDQCASFIEDGMRRGQRVLVNCVFAQSRSAAGVPPLVVSSNVCV